MGEQRLLIFTDHLKAATARGEVGMQRAADATERDVPGWCRMACEKLREFARANDGIFTIEVARLSFEKLIPAPKDLRSWGRVCRMALARGYIEQVPGEYFHAASSNGAVRAVYRAGPRASEEQT